MFSRINLHNTSFDRIADVVRSQWHATFRRAGVSVTDCDAVARAFAYDGLWLEADAES